MGRRHGTTKLEKREKDNLRDEMLFAYGKVIKLGTLCGEWLAIDL